jgi:hypothetical protein
LTPSGFTFAIASDAADLDTVWHYAGHEMPDGEPSIEAGWRDDFGMDEFPDWIPS